MPSIGLPVLGVIRHFLEFQRVLGYRYDLQFTCLRVHFSFKTLARVSMDLLISIVLILFSLIEIRKGILVLRKNQIHVFLGVQLVLCIMNVFFLKKRVEIFNKEYKKNIKSYAIQSILVWSFVLIFNFISLWLATINKELF